MNVYPGTSTTVSNAEAVQLRLDVDTPLPRVRLVPRFGVARALDLVENEFSLPPIAAPNQVALEWLDADGKIAYGCVLEVVSQHYFSLDDLAHYGDGSDDFGSRTEEELLKARKAATEVIELNAHRSFVRRIGRTKVYAPSDQIILDHNDVVEIITPGFIQIGDSLAIVDPTRPIEFPVWIEYVYGEGCVPQQISNAALTLAAYYLRPDATPSRATGEATEAGFLRYTLAGRDGVTGLPEVDATIEQFGAKPVVVL